MRNILIFKNKSCYGCGVCEVVCPPHIISIRLNGDGFYIPNIQQPEKCIQCGLCLKVCAFNSNEAIANSYDDVDFYAAWSNNVEIREKTSSGGVCYSILEYLICCGYKVCVVRYNAEHKRAEHYVATSVKELEASAGSKYLQSYPSEALKKITKKGKWAVVGTPCQIHSLRNYIQFKKRENDFILIDFFCHGVPSYHVYTKYLTEIEEKKGPSQSVSWRIKNGYGWHDSWVMRTVCRDGTFEKSFSKGDLFFKFFLRNRYLNKCCYDDCKYKMSNSYADIRMGDLWGTKYECNEDGVSGVIGLTNRGKQLLKDCEGYCTLIPESATIVMESQMKTCAHRSASYNYVKRNISDSQLSLETIDRIASRKEFIHSLLPKAQYYIRRFPIKLVELCKLKR